MGKFIPTRYAGHQQRVVKKRPVKSIVKCSKKPQGHKTKEVQTEQSEKVERFLSDTPKDVEEHKIEDPNSEFQNLRNEVFTDPNSGNKLLKLLRVDCDLFADDELKARYDQYTKYNFLYTVFDEIALEGLDGITIEALWKRIQNALKVKSLPQGLKDIIWQVVCLNEKIQHFLLPEARGDLVIFDRDACGSKDPNLAKDIFQLPEDIYKLKQPPKGSTEWGSCQALDTRVDISEDVRNMSLDEAVNTYGNKLVLAADEELRKNAVFDGLMDPNYEFTAIEYCVLERVGRARELGEATLGPASLPSSFGMDPKSVYHYCKRLKKECLVTRQYCFFSMSNVDKMKVGRLLHLRRFYHKKKSRYALMIEHIVNYLRKCPGYRAPYSSVRALFDHSTSAKFFKHQDLLKYIDTNIYVPFKEYYTEATYKEYMTKNRLKERIIQLVQLKDPYVNITACSTEGQNAESSDDDDEEGESNVNSGRRVYNTDFIRDVYQCILSKGYEGIRAAELYDIFDIDFPTLRGILKRLTLRKLVEARKKDIGRQTVNQYVATCILERPDFKTTRPAPAQTQTRPNSALEKLMAKQKKMIDSLPKERIYTMEQFELDREHQLLSLDEDPLPPVNVQVPEVACQYLIAEPRTPQLVREMNVFLVKLREALKPFKINLALPELGNDKRPIIRGIIPEKETHIVEFKEPPGELWTKTFRPDYLSKAFLLKALLDHININSEEIIGFLDPHRPAKKPEKRPLQVSKKASGKKKEVTHVKEVCSDVPVTALGMAMGSNPVLALKEEDETSGFVTEVYVSTPIGGYKTGDITRYLPDPKVSTTERVLSRIFIVLRTIQQQPVFEEMNKLLKIIHQEELQGGYDKKIDRKSLHRIYKRLNDEGYLKMFSVTIAKGASKKTQTYVCHPEVDFSHHLIQESLSQMKDKIYCYVTKADVVIPKPVPKKVVPEPAEKRSPFAEDDVLRSISEIQELTVNNIKAKSCKKSGKYYGRRPKFARLSLMHELLFYLIYELDRDTAPLSKAEVAQLFRVYEIKLTHTDLQNLPPAYCKEISWKTFIPPLPYHHGWGEGWALLIDVLLRFPITLITRCYSVNFVSAELQEVLQHPIKRFYVLRYVSPNIRMLIMYRRKFIHDMYYQLVLLSYCGLVQFGPCSFHDREKSFFYLNRRATLWDTTSSAPGYQRIEPKEYPNLRFYFDSLERVLKYWSTMNKICMHTNLNVVSLAQGKTITLVDSSAKPSLLKAKSVKTQANVEQFDKGNLPGDHQGAAGLDSSLCAHYQRSWYYFAMKKEAAPSFTETLETLKLDQVANNRVAFDKLKLLPTSSNKYYLAKPPDPKNVLSTRKVKPHKTGKTKPIIKRMVPIRKRKPPTEKKIGLDAVDKAIIRKFGGFRYRPNWNEEEDRLLILLKIASTFITPGTTKQIICYAALRDVLHLVLPKARDKTVRSMANRLRILSRSVSFLSNIEAIIPNLYKLVPIAKYFVPFRKFVLHGVDPKGFNRRFKLSDPELQNAFLFLAYYFVHHRKEVEVSLHGRNTTTDYFKKENLNYFKQNIEPFDKKEKLYLEPKTEVDIRKYTLKNTIHSALSHRQSNPAWSLRMYKIYQQFSEDVLRSIIQEMRNQRMIQSKKLVGQTFFSPYRLSIHYIFSQSCTFLFHTMEEAYKTFLELKYNQEGMDFSYEAMEEKKYGQMFGLNEIFSFMPENTTMEFKIPEHHLILNPNIEDHSEVVEELAKRYQAKLKSDQKDAELIQTELQSSSKPDDDDPEIPEPEAGPSTIEPEEPEIETLPFDDDEPLDLSITSKNSATIDNLKHWIEDCIDAERVRSPSPELLNLEVKQEQEEREVTKDESKPVPVKDTEDRILSLEEIREGMLKPYESSEKRLVPYISDLTKLLSVNFEEIERDERADYLLKRHFVQQYPSLEKVSVNGLDSFDVFEILEKGTSINDVLIRVEREARISVPSDKGAAFDEILEKGGTVEDVTLANEMLNYIHDKGIYGAAGYEIKDIFSDCEYSCPLELILKILEEHQLILRTGVCVVTFVHHKYRTPWLTSTFSLTNEQISLLPKDLQKLEADVHVVDVTGWIKIKPLPWATVEGILDKDLLKMWLSQVFSYCIENPKSPLTSVCDKFVFLKPVDVFYLVEVLEELGTVEILRVPSRDMDIFSEYDYTDGCKATLLDKFEEMYVETHNFSFTKLGSFFHEL